MRDGRLAKEVFEIRGKEFGSRAAGWCGYRVDVVGLCHSASIV
jgi:hypothetical protein